ncbi:MAG: hypothetical protein GY749_09060 [Desulfobacteraceae bacterium]|nr:hypothetical protein [Desulfobacteraceae bacterium]
MKFWQIPRVSAKISFRHLCVSRKMKDAAYYYKRQRYLQKHLTINNHRYSL